MNEDSKNILKPMGERYYVRFLRTVTQLDKVIYMHMNSVEKNCKKGFQLNVVYYSHLSSWSTSKTFTLL